MDDHYHYWYFDGPTGRAYDRMTRSSDAWNTRQAAHKALNRDYGGSFGKAGVVLVCSDDECGRYQADRQDELVQSVTGGWIRKSDILA